MKVFTIRLLTQSVSKGTRDVISSDLPFMECMSSKGDKYWNRPNRPPEVLAFSLIKNIAIKKNFKIVHRGSI